jgi:hypothetical protein
MACGYTAAQAYYNGISIIDVEIKVRSVTLVIKSIINYATEIAAIAGECFASEIKLTVVGLWKGLVHCTVFIVAYYQSYNLIKSEFP